MTPQQKPSGETLDEQYPLIARLFGNDIEVERINDIGKTNAHMVFAPDLERALARILGKQLVDSFIVQIKRKRRIRPEKGDL